MRSVLALLLLPGCMSLDFMFLDAPKLDHYTLKPKLVPEENLELVTFDRGDGVELAGVWVRQDPANPSPPLVYFHGNGGNLETDLDRIEYYWTWGRFDVFAFDYAGYGASGGTESHEALTEHDGVGALDYVSAATGLPVDQIHAAALSLGGVVSLNAVDERPVAGLVLQSVFANSDLLLDTSLELDVAPGWFFEDDWDNVAAIRDVDCPVFVVHGLADDYIDPISGPMLYEAAAGDKALWQPERVNHDDLHLVEPEAFRTRSLAFFDEHDVE